jgi:uncharacterized protein YaaR (DUF327 family)
MANFDIAAAQLNSAPLAASSLFTSLKREAKKPAQKRESGETGEARRLSFAEVLESFAPESAGLGKAAPASLPPSSETLTKLMDAVHSAGSDLRERPFAQEIISYKKAVRDFVQYVVENSFEVDTVVGLKKMVAVGDRREPQGKVYHQVRVIDGKLEELAAAILSGQVTQLTCVSKLDEITGLLVDLTLTGNIAPQFERNEK